MNSKASRSILFITGAFVSNSCWSQWQTFFEQKGYHTLAPAWLHKDAPAEALRNSQPNEAIASNRLAALTDYFERCARQFKEPPILIGHSIGGLIVQLLLQRGAGAMGIAIHAVPPQGVFTTKLSFLKAGWRALGFFTPVNKAYLISFNTWIYAFTNGMSCDDQKDSYYRFAIPESKLIVRDTTTKAAKVDFSQPHEPLLFIAGGNDNTIPASLNYSNYKKYKDTASLREYHEFKENNHFVLGQSSWSVTAGYISEWIEKQNS
jgi:alpha-beta hydrolase superfamily lysophospholipase